VCALLFQTKLIDLCCHFIGQHAVKHYFSNAARPEREKLVASLVGPAVSPADRERLRRSREGQATLRLTQAELWLRSPQEWKTHMMRHEQGLDMLRELDGVSKPSVERNKGDPAASGSARAAGASKATAEGIKVNNDEANGDVAAPADLGKRKRKRKRGGKKKSDDGVEGANEEEEEEEEDAGAQSRPPAKETARYDDAAAAAKRHAPAARRQTDSRSIHDAQPVGRLASSDRDTKTSSSRLGSARPAWNSSNDSSYRHNNSSERADMDLVRSLKSGTMMSKSMLNDAIDQLHREKASKQGK
jgi:hypothetical protein